MVEYTANEMEVPNRVPFCIGISFVLVIPIFLSLIVLGRPLNINYVEDEVDG
ncbi:hypothetical protein C2W64_01201 [Brevibacillus laterosporus]|nr:hypothetical protein C2W64_01201 [Brevibacillus laterosporus]